MDTNFVWRNDVCSFEIPCEADWKTGKVIDHGHWDVASRDSAHMNWIPLYDIDFGDMMVGHPLTSLAKEAKGLNGTASFMLECIMTTWIGEPEPYDEPISYPLEGIPISQRQQEDLAALKLLQKWLVVVRVVVVRVDLRQAAHSGLFGLSGDETVQVVEATLPLASQLYELAESCECGASAVTADQDFTRMPIDDMDDMVKRVAYKIFHDHEIGRRLRPAIMFRLCTEMCNRINNC